MSDFYRLTFKPAGATRRRTVWAIKARTHGTRQYWTVVDKEGQPWKDTTTVAGGVPTDTMEIVVTGLDYTALPASMNLKYGWLEIDNATKLSEKEVDDPS